MARHIFVEVTTKITHTYTIERVDLDEEVTKKLTNEIASAAKQPDIRPGDINSLLGTTTNMQYSYGHIHTKEDACLLRPSSEIGATVKMYASNRMEGSEKIPIWDNLNGKSDRIDAVFAQKREEQLNHFKETVAKVVKF